MVNPFDRNFFHFFFGFILILGFSFSVLYLANKYGNIIDGKKVSAAVHEYLAEEN